MNRGEKATPPRGPDRLRTDRPRPRQEVLSGSVIWGQSGEQGIRARGGAGACGKAPRQTGPRRRARRGAGGGRPSREDRGGDEERGSKQVLHGDTRILGLHDGSAFRWTSKARFRASARSSPPCSRARRL